VRIERIETIELRLPWGPEEDGVTRTWPVHRVHTDSGRVGISRGGSRQLIEEVFAPLLAGEDPRRTAQLWQRMYEAAWGFRGPGRGAMATIGALDVALWDLCGKACGEPVWRLLGGCRDHVPVYADGIGYADITAAEVGSLVTRHVGLGFTSVKFHLSSPEPDVALEKLRVAREALGPDRRLMIDIRRMWDGHLAAEMATAFEPYDLYWIEEPVRGDDEPGQLRMVREATTSLLAGGEGEGTIYGVRRLLDEGGLQVVQSDILIGGGFTGLLRIAALAESYHAHVAPHGASFPEINCHLIAAVPNGLIVPACPPTEPYQIWSRLYDPAFVVDGGEVVMSERPGLGLDFDAAFLAEHAVEPGG
jgi:D-arabinonate dehydratase